MPGEHTSLVFFTKAHHIAIYLFDSWTGREHPLRNAPFFAYPLPLLNYVRRTRDLTEMSCFF